MSVKFRAYDNKHGDPVVVLVTEGTFDVSRLVNLFRSGRCEDQRVATAVTRAMRRHNGCRAALSVLKAHGGPDLLTPVDAQSAGDQ